MESANQLFSGVSQLFDCLGDFLEMAMTYWFVFVPMITVLASKIIGSGKSLLFYRKGRRR